MQGSAQDILVRHIFPSHSEFIRSWCNCIRKKPLQARTMATSLAAYASNFSVYKTKFRQLWLSPPTLSLWKRTYISRNKISVFGNCSDKHGKGLVMQGNYFLPSKCQGIWLMYISGNRYSALGKIEITAVARLFCRGCKMDGTLLEFCHHI